MDRRARHENRGGAGNNGDAPGNENRQRHRNQNQNRGNGPRGGFNRHPRGRGAQHQVGRPEPEQVFDWFDGNFRPAEVNQPRPLMAVNPFPEGERPNRPDREFQQNQRRQNQRGRGHQRVAHGTRGNRQNDQNNDQRQNRRDGFNTFGFTRLMELTQKSSDDIAIVLAAKNTGFEHLLTNDLKPDLLVLTLRVLTKLCDASYTSIVTSILSHACSQKFLKTLETYLMGLAYETERTKRENRFYWEDVNRFWNNLTEFFRKLMQLLPNKARDEMVGILEKTSLIIETIRAFHPEHPIDEKVRGAISGMYIQLKEEIEEVEKKQQSKRNVDGAAAEEDYPEPPEDFRQLSVIPTMADLIDDNPYIRPSKTKGAYDSVEHYLDVQFRLLREDFVAPLREGINDYLHGSGKHRNTDIRVYKKVKLVSPTVVKNKVGYTIDFGAIKNVNWKRSKRFMYGGLVCLSRDNFEHVIFATVADRDEKHLQKGHLVISLCPGMRFTEDMHRSDFVMVESKVYFEPYFVVLNTLKSMSDQRFPMKRYIVDAEGFADRPRYLNENSVYVHKGINIPLMNRQQWPSPQRLELDISQYEAFRSALLQEFAVIQGPPGTGKTYIALQIAGALLTNKSSWYDQGPLVVVCLTNHALDQFLEGILTYTKSLVRVGGQCKNPNLEQYMLKNVRQANTRNRKRGNAGGSRLMYQYKRELEGVLQHINNKQATVKALSSNRAIVSPAILRRYCNDEELRGLSDIAMLSTWLLGDQASVVHGKTAPLMFPPQNLFPNPGEQMSDSDSDGEDMYVDDELDLENILQNDSSGIDGLFNLDNIAAIIRDGQMEIQALRANRVENEFTVFDPVIELTNKIGQLEHLHDVLQARLNEHPLMNGRNHQLPRNNNWGKYWRWIQKSHQAAMAELTSLDQVYQTVVHQLDEAKQVVDVEVMKESLVVGLTTAGAARLHASLRALRAPIVLVEEAAEVLEAHIVCSLTEHCQHVILIGDHKQLRPNAAVYQLGIKYNLNISLFERMINIRGRCTQLEVQHRMQPLICKLICPSIYEKLSNHISVYKYPPVKGVQKNLFFLNHSNREANHNNEESWANPHEVKFLVSFARHLMLQGYGAEEITILCTYTGQMFALMKERERHATMRHLRMTTVDNYQGEENRIILLSLVRNNPEGNIGFLKTENRVCVALSRAREGLYIMGNMDNLTTKNVLWPKIKSVLEHENAIGDSLALRCQIHIDQVTEVKDAEDFKNCPEGGCLLVCGINLPCGHECKSVCHVADREHKEYRCNQRCLKTCPNDHQCRKLCWQSCPACNVIVQRKLKCNHLAQMMCSVNPLEYLCTVKVTTLLPHCDHSVEKPCHRDANKFPCPYPCEVRPQCGHSCRLTCHANDDADHLEYKCQKDCPKVCGMKHPCKKRCSEECGLCVILVRKDRSCGHFYKIPCWQDVETVDCTKPCKRIMSCGHKCKLKCDKLCGNCVEMVEKTSMVCGHKVFVTCWEEPTLEKCEGNCQRRLNCGHPCRARCKDVCTVRCKELVPLTGPALCGHSFKVPCYKAKLGFAAYAHKLLMHCDAPCGIELACGHRCLGTCGTCKQGRIHAPCGEKCGNIMICGHPCVVPCRQFCPPCTKPCQLKCIHTKCNRKCGEPCTPCLEPCSRQCAHSKCTKKCSELCDVKPCERPCLERLKCGHLCVGFCGEPCPPLCRICDKEELTEVLFGDEDEPGSRFVFLQDCNHCIESGGLSQWVSQKSSEVGIKLCPKCKTPITKCMRYMDEIKTEFIDVQLIKKKVFERGHKDLQDKQKELLRDIENIKLDSQALADMKSWNQLVANLLETVRPVTINKRRQVMDAQAAEATGIVLKMSKEILLKVSKVKDRTVPSWPVVRNEVILLLESFPTRGQISAQEITDIELELQRLHYMIELCTIEEETAFKMNKSVPKVKNKLDILCLELLNLKRFNKWSIDDVHIKMIALQEALKLSSTVTREERQAIVRAVGLAQGHWFKCPNGHFYAIGECGGAMQRSKCIECGATIGGGQHRLDSGNAVAPEMDGATRAAWPQ